MPALKNPEGSADAQKAQLDKITTRFKHLRLLTILGNAEDLSTERGLRDQFFTADFKLGTLKFMGLPALKAIVPDNPPPPPPPDSPVLEEPHYKCFEATQSRDTDLPTITVKELKTQLQFPPAEAASEKNVDIGASAQFLCVPALKKPDRYGTPDQQRAKLKDLEDRFPHLFCHNISGDTPNNQAHIRTQTAVKIIKDGLEQSRQLGPAQYLCAPAIKSFVTNQGSSAMQLHMTGPVPNRVRVGQTSSLTAVFQIDSVGVGVAEVLFEKVSGSFSFTSGEISDDGQNTSAMTDTNGVATITISVDGPGASLIRVTVPETPLMAFSLFFGI